MWLGMSWLDWLVVFGYLVLVTALGVMAYRKVDDMRTAAYLCAIEKVGAAYLELGIFP